MRLLVAESDPALGTFLQRGFDGEHYAVDLAQDGEQAKSLAQQNDYDLAILDLNLPAPDGLEVLQHVRAKCQQLPILILATRNQPQERAHVLDLGADDLVLKPFAFSELSARVRALLRRRSRSPQSLLHVEDLELDRVERTVRRAGRSIELTPKEFSLLEYLMRNAGQRVTRAQIIEHVWNLSYDTMSSSISTVLRSAAPCTTSTIACCRAATSSSATRNLFSASPMNFVSCIFREPPPICAPRRILPEEE